MDRLETRGLAYFLAVADELVRDTKDRSGGTLTFTAEAWAAFTDLLK